MSDDDKKRDSIETLLSGKAGKELGGEKSSLEKEKDITEKVEDREFMPEKKEEAEETKEQKPETSETENSKETEDAMRQIAAAQARQDEDKNKPAAKPVVHVQADGDMGLEEIAKLPKEEQVGELTKVVMKEGLYQAIDMAKKLKSPYILDMLHDALVDAIYEELKGPKVNK